MTTGTHTFTFAGFDWSVSYTFHRGCPEASPAYAHGGLPADPDEIELYDWMLGDQDADDLIDCLDDKVRNDLIERLEAEIVEKEYGDE